MTATPDQPSRKHHGLDEFHHHDVVSESGGPARLSHYHADGADGHTHPAAQRFPKRADGGYLQPETGPAYRAQIRLDTETLDELRKLLRGTR